MKIMALALVAAFSIGGALYKAPSLRSSNSHTSVETVTVKSNTVAGNLVDQRLNPPNSQPLSSTRKILKFKLNHSRVIYLNSEVSTESTQSLAEQIKELNKESNEDIFLLINSPGGSVLDGASLISEMEASSAHVNTVCTGFCASMAAMIHSYGYKRYATDRAILMYHPASAGIQGQVPNMLSQLTTITRYLDKMVSNIVTRSKVSKSEFDSLVSYELWVDAEDAEQKGLTDGTVNLDVPSQPSSPQSLYLPTPEQPSKEKSVTAPKPFKVMLITDKPVVIDQYVRQN